MPKDAPLDVVVLIVTQQEGSESETYIAIGPPNQENEPIAMVIGSENRAQYADFTAQPLDPVPHLSHLLPGNSFLSLGTIRHCIVTNSPTIQSLYRLGYHYEGDGANFIGEFAAQLRTVASHETPLTPTKKEGSRARKAT